jgi:DNA-binding SARP family transcriptional activator
VEKTFIKTVSMLGSFRLHTSSGSSIAIKGKKNAALLARLLLEPSKHINRSDAEALLWSQRSSDQAKASLRQCLSELRKQLEDIANIELQANRNDISLSLDSVKIDAEEIVDIANSDEIQPKLGFVDLCSGAVTSTALNARLPDETVDSLARIQEEWSGLDGMLENKEIDDFSDETVNSFMRFMGEKKIVSGSAADLADAIKIHSMSRH